MSPDSIDSLTREEISLGLISGIANKSLPTLVDLTSELGKFGYGAPKIAGTSGMTPVRIRNTRYTFAHEEREPFTLIVVEEREYASAKMSDSKPYMVKQVKFEIGNMPDSEFREVIEYFKSA